MDDNPLEKFMGVLLFGILLIAGLSVAGSTGAAGTGSYTVETEEPPNDSQFTFRSAGVPIDSLVSGAFYDDNAWDYIADLQLNVLRISSEINAAGMLIHTDAGWATTLNSFLELTYSHGVQVYWAAMGHNAAGFSIFFGIIPPDEAGGVTIEEAKDMVDHLAGNNALAHNFITDPRIYGWCVGNEQNLTDTDVLNWDIELIDYIKSKGGAAWAAAPILLDEYCDAGAYYTLLGTHVSLCELHYYGEYEYVTYFERDTVAWGGYADTQAYFEDVFHGWTAGSYGTNVLLGEFGCWRGNGTAEGLVSVTFTDADRINVYNAMLAAANHTGIPRASFHQLFSTTVQEPDYGLVKDIATGEGYWDDDLATVVRGYYA